MGFDYRPQIFQMYKFTFLSANILYQPHSFKNKRVFLICDQSQDVFSYYSGLAKALIPALLTYATKWMVHLEARLQYLTK